jgi:AhpC/TSA family protein
VRAPADRDIPAPELPPESDWLNAPFVRLSQLLGSHAVLLEFWDFARINSLRTLPYVKGWHARYEDSGLAVIGVHSPGYSFGRDRDTVARAVERLEVGYPVALDPDYEIWRAYGVRGWPARYLFDRRGLLRWFHFGEGDYEGTERAIQETLLEIDPELELPEPLEPIRPEDAPGMVMEPQTADVALPADRDRLELVRDWVDGEDYIEAADAGGAATVSFRAGGAWAVLSEGGLEEPGLYETDGRVVAEHPGLRLHGFQFTPEPGTARPGPEGRRRPGPEPEPG